MTSAVMTRKKTEYYVNNKEFLAAITEYRQKVLAAKESTPSNRNQVESERMVRKGERNYLHFDHHRVS